MQPNKKNTPAPYLHSGLTNAMMYNIGNIILKWGDAAGPFLSIEPSMRLIAELHIPFREKVAYLINSRKKPPKYKDYWDCDPSFLTESLILVFGKNMSLSELEKISKFPAIRGKFLHGNFVELMDVMGIEPTSRRSSQQMGQFKKERLQPGEIYDSFLSMDSNRTFDLLRQYSSDVRNSLKAIISNLGS